jgi:hypothetical protein
MPMKTFLAILGSIVLISASTRAQSAPQIIKMRAKELSNQNNVQQGVASPSQPAQPAAGPRPGTPLTPLQLAIARLRAALAAIKADPAPTAQQKQQLAQQLIATAQGNKPSQQTSAKLADDLSAALAANPMSGTDRDRLLSDINAALNPEKYQPDQLKQIEADAQAIFQVGGVKRASAVAVADDLKAIVAETKR